MKVGIIGAGNMGGAIACGLASGRIVDSCDICITCPNRRGELDKIKAFDPEVKVSTNIIDAVNGCDIIILAVKPWMLDNVLAELEGTIDFSRQILASVVAGVELSHYEEYAGTDKKPAIFRLIPNIAISVQESMTFIAAKNASQEQIKAVSDIFAEMGKVMLVDEHLMGAGSSIASCGIAYAMRYIRAAMEGGVELGLSPVQAQEAVMQTLIGAVKILQSSGNHPESEIDKVTTPGGYTIKGLNAMEKNNFTTAVIEGLKASISK